MYVVDEGKSKVVEIGVYILETLGSVGLPADQVTQVLLRYTNLPHPTKGQITNGSNGGSESDAKKKKKSSSKRRRRRARDALIAAKSRETRILRQAQEDARRRKLATRSGADGRSGNKDLFQRAMRFVVEARNSSPQQIISRILFYLADALGESLDDPSKRDLERAVDAFMEEAHFQRGRGVKLGHLPPHLGKSVTGVVLSYRERDDLQLPPAVLSRIRRGMHFEIPVRPFDATVQLLPPPQMRKRNVTYAIQDQDYAHQYHHYQARKRAAAAASATQQQHHHHHHHHHHHYQRGGGGSSKALEPHESRPEDDNPYDSELAEAAEAEAEAALAENLYLMQHVEDNDFVSRLMASRVASSNASTVSHAGAGSPSAADGAKARPSDCVVPCSPKSFPATPDSRSAVLDYSLAFTENVLWRARDELRGEQVSDDRPRMAIFNQEDAHPKIILTCGGHCASLDYFIGARRASFQRQDDAAAAGDDATAAQEPGQQPKQQRDVTRAPLAQRIYRSVRAALALPYGRTTYFEMCPVWAGDEIPDPGHAPLHVCVGLSTRSMALRNTVPGCSANTAGLDSSGVLLVCGHRTRTNATFSYGSVVGVCVRAWISHLLVAFFVDGKQVACHAQELGLGASPPRAATNSKSAVKSDDDAPPDNATTVAAAAHDIDASGAAAETSGWLQAFPIRNLAGQEPAAFYPTVSLKSRNVKVFAHFSAEDMRHTDLSSTYWSAISRFVPGEPIYALDGTLLCGDHYRGQSTAE